MGTGVMLYLWETHIAKLRKSNLPLSTLSTIIAHTNLKPSKRVKRPGLIILLGNIATPKLKPVNGEIIMQCKILHEATEKSSEKVQT